MENKPPAKAGVLEGREERNVKRVEIKICLITVEGEKKIDSGNSPDFVASVLQNFV